MLDPKILRTSITDVAAQLKKRGFILDTETFNVLEDKRKNLQIKVQELQNERNVKSKALGIAKAQGEDIDGARLKLKEISDELKNLEDEFNKIQLELDVFFASIPNITHESVSTGQSEVENIIVRTWGTPKEFAYTPKDHAELACVNGWMDFETAAKLSGARFVVLRGPIARLHRALIQFMLDLHIEKHGYQEISVPYIVKGDCLFGTGQLPKFKEDMFALQGEGERYLISTAEIPVTNTQRDEIIDQSKLPLKYVCYSPCFRSEAGTYGKDMRGMFRQHQFEKVELVQFVTAENSYAALEELTQHAETVLQQLQLPYRVMSLCTGDIGFSAAKTYDLEVWLPGQNKFREISSCSNFENFQARRMKARVRDANGKIDLLHTLNGSALAIGRTLIAVIENYQDQLGRIHIPQVLQKYMSGLEVIE